MLLGFLTGDLNDIRKAATLGFDAVELHAQALGSGTSGPLDPDKIARAGDLVADAGAKISALAYYDGARISLDGAKVADAYGHVFDAAAKLGVGVVASMSGFEADRDWSANVDLFAERFAPVAEIAERAGMKVAFENWMAVHGRLPFRPVNFGGSPDTWDALFGAVPSPALGLEFDPSHLYWQGIDPIRALKEYAHRVYHVHAKDTEMLPERRYRGGINGEYFRFRIPGYGEIDWPRFVSTLDEIGYTGGVAIEHEDPIYSGERFDEGLVRGWQTLHPLLHPASEATRR